MNQPLNQEQLNQIIAEVQTLQLRQESELNQQQIKEILQDLNLPPELLDEALIQIRRKQALEVQQSRNKLIGFVVATSVIIGIGLTVFFHQQPTLLRHQYLDLRNYLATHSRGLVLAVTGLMVF